MNEREKIAHLLRRFGLGASAAELAFYEAGGVSGAVDLLLNPPHDEGFDFPFGRLADQRGNINVQVGRLHWYTRLLLTRWPLREKLTLFWHDHFATSASKVASAFVMSQHIEVLRGKGSGRFGELLEAVSKDPAMIFWLDNQLNTREKPNENFAREVMELFTVGIGHYTEKDVQEVARAFTGWGFGRAGNRQAQTVPRGQVAQFVFNPRNHDSGMKTILGNRGPFTGEDVLGILAGHPQTALHLVTKMWEFFVYANPEASLVDRLARHYRSNGMRADALLRAIVESPEFFSPKATRQLYKSPVDFCIATLRQLGVASALRASLATAPEGQVARALVPAAAAARSTKAMGMELQFPPDVAGWDWGASWITSATMLERVKWADRLFGPPAPRQLNLRLPAGSIFDTSSSAAFTRSLLTTFDADLPAAKVAQLEQAVTLASDGNLARNASPSAHAACRLLFATPEFQFC